MADTREILLEHATAATWPTADAHWTTRREIDVRRASDGIGQVLGDALAEIFYGRDRRPYDSSTATRALPAEEDVNGRYVRLLRPSATGTVTRLSTTWTPFWWGFCAKATRRFFGVASGKPAVGRTSLHLVGLMGLLQQVVCLDGYETNPSSGNAIKTFHAPTFNRGGVGNMSGATKTVNGVAVRVFDNYNRGAYGSAGTWTLAEAIKYLLATFTTPHGGPWVFVDASTLGTQTIGEVRYHGRALLQVLLDLTSPRRGTVLQADTDSTGKPRVTLRDWWPTTGITLDVTDRSVLDCTLEADTVASFDELTALSQLPPLTAQTLTYAKTGTHSLAPDGWTAGSFPTTPNAPNYRRWKLTGDAIDNLRVQLDTVANEFTGTRTKASAASDKPTARAAKVERLLPMRPTQSTATIDPLQSWSDRASARIFVRRTSGAATWEDWSDKLQVVPREDPLGLELNGDTDQLAELFRCLDTHGGELRITVGVRELAPIRRSDLPGYAGYRGTRQLAREVAGLEQGFVPAGTAIAVASNALVTASTDTHTWSAAADAVEAELDRMLGSVPGYRPALSMSVRGLQWDLPPGTLVSDLDAGGASLIPAEVTIVRRTWTFNGANCSTSYESVYPAAGQAED
jgi:hypothetical protein